MEVGVDGIPLDLPANEYKTICSEGGVVLRGSGHDRSVRGNTFAYTNGNVLICFRKANPTTYASLGGNDLVVNAGPINYFTNLAPNTKVTITAYTGGQLGQVATNSVGWSAWLI